MSGIDRVLAGIALVGAVGGAAGFALHSGSDSSAQAVSLTAPPFQHVDASGAILFARTPPPIRVAVEVRRRSRPVPVAIVPPRAQAVAIRAATAAPKPAPAPVSPPEPPRVLAAVPLAAIPLTPVQPATETPAPEGKTHGRALGHTKTRAKPDGD